MPKAILYSEHRVLFMLHAQCYICSSLRGVYCVGTRLFFFLFSIIYFKERGEHL